MSIPSVKRGISITVDIPVWVRKECSSDEIVKEIMSRVSDLAEEVRRTLLSSSNEERTLRVGEICGMGSISE